jgi:molecular chaperone GrpE
VQVLQPGYRAGDRLLRAARVAVADPPADVPADEPADEPADQPREND